MTVPTDPEIPRLFEVRSKLTESAYAYGRQASDKKPTARMASIVLVM